MQQLVTVLRPRLFLITLGISSLLLYMFYFVRSFPVWTYGQSIRLTELGNMTKHSSPAFILFITVLCILFFLTALAWKEAREREGEDFTTFIIIFLFGSMFTLVMTFCYPITAIDIYIYISHSHVLVTHHANPLITPPETFLPADPLMYLAGQYANRGAPYGPLGILISSAAILLTGRDMFANLLMLKTLYSIMVIACGWLVYRILSLIAPKYALAGMVLFLWNPLIIFEYAANSHNDIAVMLFVLLAILAVTKERLVMAFALIVLSVLVKYSTLPLLPLFLLHGIINQPNHRQRFIYLARIVGVSIIIVGAIFGPFWGGSKTLEIALGHDNWFLASFSVVLCALFGLDGNTAKLISRIIFGVLYFIALLLSGKRIVLSSAIVMSAFLAFGTVKFEPWYSVWALALAVLLPGKIEGIASILFSFGASLIAPLQAFIWIWGGRTDKMYDNLNPVMYLVTFLPALLIISLWNLRYLSINISLFKEWYEKLRAIYQRSIKRKLPLIN